MEEEKTQKKPYKKDEKKEERLVRILSKDIEGKLNVYAGLTKIKGVSWAISNATCKSLGIKKTKKIGELTDDEINKITNFIKKLEVPGFLKNQQKNFESGEDKHLVGSDLELKTEFDIKRLKKIKSYRGLRHSAGLPTRGQRTKSNFRPNRRRGAGIKKKEEHKQ
jgi:small subunit ribosomal protein S13